MTLTPFGPRPDDSHDTGPQHYSIMKLAAMDQYLDFWNLM